MTRIIRVGEKSASSDVTIPPGAWMGRFYQMNDLVANTSGVDCHMTGARLIKIALLLGTVSTADVIVQIQKNDLAVFEVIIPAGWKTATYDVRKIESSISMDFRAVVDTIRVAVIDPGAGAKDLTVLAVFDR